MSRRICSAFRHTRATEQAAICRSKNLDIVLIHNPNIQLTEPLKELVNIGMEPRHKAVKRRRFKCYRAIFLERLNFFECAAFARVGEDTTADFDRFEILRLLAQLDEIAHRAFRHGNFRRYSL